MIHYPPNGTESEVGLVSSPYPCPKSDYPLLLHIRGCKRRDWLNRTRLSPDRGVGALLGRFWQT